MSQRRQLAAIMFTDIEGYTAAMQRDEQRAISLRNRHREVLQAKHKQYNGQVIQYYGDGTLSIFSSVVEAVQCALEMQIQYRNIPYVPVRIGLHVGDIIYDNEQIIGDGVNFAARIESLGVAGSVLLSDKVNDEINNHPNLKTQSVGIYRLKNIDRPVEVFAIANENLIIPAVDSLKGKTEEKKRATIRKKESLKVSFDKPMKNGLEKSIAVLPFVNMSNDPEQEYFGDGIAEEILSSLSNLKELKVAGRSSSFQFNNRAVNLKEIKEKLGVSTVLEGSVRKQGNRIRITVQLVNVDDGFHLWSERYDREMDDVFAIQDEIATAISEKLRITMLDTNGEKLTKVYTTNTEAYDLYLKGKFYINRRGASLVTGLKFFEEALELDPDFALAHAGYADANLLLAFYGLFPPLNLIQKAKASAEKAIQIDPTLCEPYCSLGLFHTFNWNWEEAETNFQKALEINHDYSVTYHWYGLNLLAWVKGEFGKAERFGKEALLLEPFSALTHAAYGAILFSVGKYEECLSICKAGLKIDAYSFLCRVYEGNANVHLKRYDEAIIAYEKAMKISNRHHFAQNGLIITYCKLGDYETARALMMDLKKRESKTYISCGFIGISAAYLGDIDEAFTYFERAYADKEPNLLTFKHDPWIPENIKADPRFKRLIDQIGFPS